MLVTSDGQGKLLHLPLSVGRHQCVVTCMGRHAPSSCGALLYRQEKGTRVGRKVVSSVAPSCIQHARWGRDGRDHISRILGYGIPYYPSVSPAGRPQTIPLYLLQGVPDMFEHLVVGLGFCVGHRVLVRGFAIGKGERGLEKDLKQVFRFAVGENILLRRSS